MNSTFFESVIAAGAILSGFCGTFLAFRIQREAAYYRQPVLDFTKGEAKDVYIGLTHFTAPFLLLILATVASLLFGFVVPLLGIAGVRNALVSLPSVVAGLLAAVILLAAYFVAELFHYQIMSSNLVHDVAEWKSGKVVVLVSLVLSFAAAAAALLSLR